MLHKEGRSRNKGGDYELCVYNSQIQDEVHKLFEAQRSADNPKATKEFEAAFIECLTWEKKALDHDERTYALVGQCSYFPTEKRAANADVSSELCRTYERLKHLVIIHEDGAEQRLTPQQIDEYIAVLFSPSRSREKGQSHLQHDSRGSWIKWKERLQGRSSRLCRENRGLCTKVLALSAGSP